MRATTVAIVGAGWSGLSAAVAATQAGHDVTIFEAARTLGGRARAVQATLADGQNIILDNGQHILIGAYTQTLRLMRQVGIDVDTALLRMPLTMVFPDGMGLRFPKLPAPLDALIGIVSARGWSWRDKLSLLRVAAGWLRTKFECEADRTVADLCGELTHRVRAEMIDPLCVSALNTAADAASGQVFLRVLRDAMFGVSGGSNLLLPRVDLGALFPEAAARWVAAHGGRIAPGCRVQAIVPAARGWRIVGDGDKGQAGVEDANGEFDHVVLACPPGEAARLVESSGVVQARSWSANARALRFEAITTVYLEGGHRLPKPMLALRSTPDAPAQFVFDRARTGGPDGLWAMVVSASSTERAMLESQVVAQAREQLGCADPRVVLTVVEKRATFACTPGLARPPMSIAPGLDACGDYIEGPYPATLEGAVMSGLAAAAKKMPSP
ncbi:MULTISPECIES: hydroxysqualene dehydroxylase HpnE [unclassified Variovorax]|uniref:hydroxysqualene dehydroxylase HpnE n=1 Tax=unclassified Variovorax TaxID=663243 RepID=UPI002B22DDEC|nr:MULTISPECIES: hydroxysqualene dehydroxylase HpnE [unclassified Variovorax]MEB0057662.1 hydroxysqualene dehydroxylase HpnE [Variovorax sp. LG9.2]MEB0114050.1 hydroxysqualene dehydroxylase HpnE [Variovorax sp. RTB1]